MPELTMASAISRTILSLTWLRNLFQLFQPMGGVCASPLLGTVAGIGNDTSAGCGGNGPGAVEETCASSTTCGAGGVAGPRPGCPVPRPGPRPPRRPPNPGSVSFNVLPSTT